MDTKQVFQLIDQVLPFEACLYHQFLPLELAGNRLSLGMVLLEDVAALEYARRIAGYLHYSLAPQLMSSEIHHEILSAYLKMNQVTGQPKADASSQSPGRQFVDEAAITHAEGNADWETEADLPANAIPLLDCSGMPADFHGRSTLIVDRSQTTDLTTDLSRNSAEADRFIQGTELAAEILPEAPEALPPQIFAPPPSILPPVEWEQRQIPEFSPPGSFLPILEVKMQFLHSSPEMLMSLPPARLLQELLGRILLDGIGRLHLQQQGKTGRVFWSQNGVVQSVLDTLPLWQFQGLLDGLKELTHLPIQPVEQVTQVEIERLCQKQRVLLRLRISPIEAGEEATLQILRGSALKFYQKQQLRGLRPNEQGIAERLRQRISELRDRRTGGSGELWSENSQN